MTTIFHNDDVDNDNESENYYTGSNRYTNHHNSHKRVLYNIQSSFTDLSLIPYVGYV